MAYKAVIISALILLAFSLIGTPFLAAMGISIQAFRIFGGLLLFLMVWLCNALPPHHAPPHRVRRDKLREKDRYRE